MAQTLDHVVAEWKRTRSGRLQPDLRLREDALGHFLSRGFPTTREEEWRFTSVAPIAERAFAIADATGPDAVSVDIDRLRLPDAAAEMVFVNGHYAPALSRMSPVVDRLRVDSLAVSRAEDGRDLGAHLARLAPVERHPFVALNTAFLDDGAYVELPAGTIVDAPIHLVFVATEDVAGRAIMAHPRVLVVLGANSHASIVETYAGPAGAQYFTNTVAEIVLGEDAVLNHYKLQYEGRDASHVGATYVQAQRRASYTSSSISLGGALVRNDIVAVLNGEGVECTLNGLYCADAQRLVDNHTTIDHAQPHCDSREIYKGILADRARGVFNGRIIVRPDAQRTDAKQTNRALLLSEDAQINTTPQLEIFANDVKCTHGAAVGQLDEDALFYLRSRGLGETDARRLLIHAFAADVLNHVPLDAIRVSAERRLLRELAGALGQSWAA